MNDATRLDHVIAGALLIARGLVPMHDTIIITDTVGLHDTGLQREAERRGHRTDRRIRGNDGGRYSITTVVVANLVKLMLFSTGDEDRTYPADPATDVVTPAIAALAAQAAPVRIAWARDDDPPEECSLAEFLADNDDDDDLCDRVRGLEIGNTITGGGGASPAYRVTRVG